MDFNSLKEQATTFMHNQQQHSSTSNQQQQQGYSNDQNANSNTMGGQNANNSGEDSLDKGLDFIEKKTGHVLSREQNEKITDGARNMFEKLTGKHVDAKYSN